MAEFSLSRRAILSGALASGVLAALPIDVGLARRRGDGFLALCSLSRVGTTGLLMAPSFPKFETKIRHKRLRKKIRRYIKEHPRAPHQGATLYKANVRWVPAPRGAWLSTAHAQDVLDFGALDPITVSDLSLVMNTPNFAIEGPYGRYGNLNALLAAYLSGELHALDPRFPLPPHLQQQDTQLIQIMVQPPPPEPDAPVQPSPAAEEAIQSAEGQDVQGLLVERLGVTDDQATAIALAWLGAMAVHAFSETLDAIGEGRMATLKEALRLLSAGVRAGSIALTIEYLASGAVIGVAGLTGILALVAVVSITVFYVLPDVSITIGGRQIPATKTETVLMPGQELTGEWNFSDPSVVSTGSSTILYDSDVTYGDGGPIITDQQPLMYWDYFAGEWRAMFDPYANQPDNGGGD